MLLLGIEEESQVVSSDLLRLPLERTVKVPAIRVMLLGVVDGDTSFVVAVIVVGCREKSYYQPNKRY